MKKKRKVGRRGRRDPRGGRKQEGGDGRRAGRRLPPGEEKDIGRLPWSRYAQWVGSPSGLEQEPSVFHVTGRSVSLGFGSPSDRISTTRAGDPPQDEHAIRKQEGLFPTLGHHEDGPAELRLEPQQLMLQARPGQGVEGGKGFVQKDDFLSGKNRRAKGSSVASCRPIPGRACCFVPAEAESAKQFKASSPIFRAHSSRNAHREQGVFQETGPGEEEVLLLHEGHQPAKAFHRPARPRNASLPKGHEPGQALEKGGFPAAGTADDDPEPAPGKPERSLFEKGTPPKSRERPRSQAR